jgi:uncharacterized glyoxalase superfamily protein PhnB
MKITPVLLVNQIEKCLPFWVDALGFEKSVEVPDGARLGFVILKKGSAEVMYQTYESVKKDLGEAFVTSSEWKTNLFIEVDDFDDILKRVAGAEVYLPVRTAFYGMKEIGVREPGGHYVCFAARSS